MHPRQSILNLRVRYSETDQMGTFYNARALEWFECGRTDYMHFLDFSYREVEARGVFLPVIEAHLNYAGRARYDDALAVATCAYWIGKVRLKFEHEIRHAETGNVIVSGYTLHAVIDPSGKPIRPPMWLSQLFTEGNEYGPNRGTSAP